MTFPIEGRCPICNEFPCTNIKVCWELNTAREDLAAAKSRIKQLEKGYDELRKVNNRLAAAKAEIAPLRADYERLRRALEDLLAYSTGGKWGHDESPDEFIRKALKGE
jgi:hypothetical protein